MTEKEKMLAGELYNAYDGELSLLRRDCRRLCEEYNRIPAEEHKKREEVLRRLLGGAGKSPTVLSEVNFDYGCNTFVGDNFFSNYGCVFIDCAKLTFGDNVLIGPQCGFYTAGHPLDKMLRREVEFAKPICVGSDVWFGGGVRVLPGVTIGSNVVVGAGSVVVRDIPSGSVAVGNPARVIRKL